MKNLMNYKTTKLNFCHGPEQILRGKLRAFTINGLTQTENNIHKRSQETLRRQAMVIPASLGKHKFKIIQQFCACLHSIMSSYPLEPIKISLGSKTSETVSYQPVYCKRPSFVSLALALYCLHLVPVMNTCTDIPSQQIDFVTNDTIIDFVVS